MTGPPRALSIPPPVGAASAEGARYNAERERERRLFGQLLLQTHQPLPAPLLEAELGRAAASPAALEQLLAGATASDVKASNAQHVSVEIQAGKLGRVALNIGRSERGVNVALVIEDRALSELAYAEAAALKTSLEARGLSVASLSIEAREVAGTLLAQVVKANEGTTVQRKSRELQQSRPRAAEKSERRTAKRLKLIG
jgi:hypothetical protein